MENEKLIYAFRELVDLLADVASNNIHCSSRDDCENAYEVISLIVRKLGRIKEKME